MRRISLVAALIGLGVLSMSCSKAKLIAQKDQQIAALQGEVGELQGQLDSQLQLNEDLEKALADYNEKEQVWMREKEGLMQITLDGAATFESARAELSPEAKDIVDRIWEVLRQYPDRTIMIEGHADDRQIARSYQYKYKSNWELSSARAHAVLHYIQKKYGTAPERIVAVGCGEYRPVSDNATEAGRTKNRRVVITVGPKMSKSKEMNKPET